VLFADSEFFCDVNEPELTLMSATADYFECLGNEGLEHRTR
jgi:hypothetical protein